MNLNISRKILIQRWTTELTSLRRRIRLDKEQEARSLDLKMFLAAIDPLRKHEYDWNSQKGFHSKITKEIKTQNNINQPDYRKNLKAKITYALAGTSTPEPGIICNIDKAKIICEDHGESWQAMVNELIEDKYLRKESGGLSISTLGCNIVERQHTNVAKPKDENPNVLFSRLGESAKSQLASLKLDLNPSADIQDRIFPDRPKAVDPRNHLTADTAARLGMRPGTRSVHFVQQTLPKKVLVKKVAAPKTIIKDDCASIIKKHEAKGANPATILNTLLLKKLIEPWQEQLVLLQGDSEVDAIWECTITSSALPGKAFAGQGPNRKSARSNPTKEFLEELKTIQRVKPTTMLYKFI